MANRFPTYTTNASFSAPTQPYLSLGGEQVGRAYQGLGQAGLNLSADVYVRQGQVQVAEFGAETQADLRAMYNKLEKTTNEDEYDAIFEGTWEGIQARAAEVSNGWARRRISLSLPGAREKQLGLVQEAKKKRIADKEEFQLIQAGNEAVETGNMNRYNALLAARVQTGSMTAEEARVLRDKTARLSQRTQVVKTATDDPESILELDTWEEFHQAYPEQIPEGYTYFQGLAARAKGKAQAEQVAFAKEQAAKFESDATINLLAGRFETKDANGKTISTYQAILDNPYLTPAQRRTLASLYDSTVKSYAREKPYSDDEKFAAYVEIRTAPAEDKMNLLAKHASGLGFTQVKMLYDKMQNPASEDNFIVDSMEASLDAIRSYRIARIKEEGKSAKDIEDAIVELEANLTRRKMAVLSKIDADPNLTDDQKLQILDKELKPIREETARNIVENAGLWKRLTAGTVVAPNQVYGRWAPMQSHQGDNQPTPEELRRRNTREAYDLGVKLGYWQ